MISLSEYLKFNNSVIEATAFLTAAADREWIFGKCVRLKRMSTAADFGWADGAEKEAVNANAANTTGEARCLTRFCGIVDGRVRLNVDFRYMPHDAGFSTSDISKGNIPFPSHEMLAQRDAIEALLVKWVSDPFNVKLPPSGPWASK